MSLGEKIADDLKTAMKSGDKDMVSILRMIKSSIKNQEIDKKESLNDEEVSAILRMFVKRAKEAMEQFTNGGRTELAEKETKELAIIQTYLPKQLNEDDIRKIVREAIDETGAAGPKDMGKVMKVVMVKAKGQIDGKLTNVLVKEMLEA